jgi:hypothetical protein
LYMTKSKYAKLITTNCEQPEGPPEWFDKVPRDSESGAIVTWLDNDVIPGGFYYEAFMAMKPTLEGSYNDPPQIHDEWDEVIGMYGTNPADPSQLFGEVHLTLGDEVQILTKSCAVFVPRGLQHGPLVIKKVTTPIILVTTGNSPKYIQRLPQGWEKSIKVKNKPKAKTPEKVMVKSNKKAALAKPAVSTRQVKKGK